MFLLWVMLLEHLFFVHYPHRLFHLCREPLNLHHRRRLNMSLTFLLLNWLNRFRHFHRHRLHYLSLPHLRRRLHPFLMNDRLGFRQRFLDLVVQRHLFQNHHLSRYHRPNLHHHRVS
jgi:hypothetical protein